MNITLAWHITKKDLRGSRDLILVGVALVTVQVLLRTVWPPLTMSIDVDLAEAVNTLRTALPFVISTMSAAIVAHVVQADPLDGADGFWLTRPISRGTLLVSKLMTIASAVVIPAVFAQLVPMFAFGVPVIDATRLVSEFLFYLAVGLMVVLAAAALTPNPRVLVTWVAAVGLVWAGATIAASSMSTRPANAEGPMQVMTAFILMGVGSSAVAWYQYRTRRTVRSALIAAATAMLVMGIPYVFEPPKAEARIPSLTDEPAVPLGSGVHYKDGARSIVMWPLGDDAGQCKVMVRVTQTLEYQPINPPPSLSYGFVDRPSGKAIAFTYFALPHRSLELASGQVVVDTELRERFQILYRHTFVGPIYPSGGPRDPSSSEFRSVSCRDIDVVVRH